MTALVAFTPKESNPQGGEHVLEQELIADGNAIGMMRSLQRMFESLINRLDKGEARALAPAEFLPRAPAVVSSFHRELEKVKFPSSWVLR
jgi:hypothetical protein